MISTTEESTRDSPPDEDFEKVKTEEITKKEEVGQEDLAKEAEEKTELETQKKDQKHQLKADSKRPQISAHTQSSEEGGDGDTTTTDDSEDEDSASESSNDSDTHSDPYERYLTRHDHHEHHNHHMFGHHHHHHNHGHHHHSHHGHDHHHEAEDDDYKDLQIFKNSTKDVPKDYIFDVLSTVKVYNIIKTKLMKLADRFSHLNLDRSIYLEALMTSNYDVSEASCYIEDRLMGFLETRASTPDAELKKDGLFCNICYCELKPDEVLKFDCNHVFCKECMSDYVTYRIDTGPAGCLATTCPFHGCEFKISTHVVKKAVSKKYYIK